MNWTAWQPSEDSFALTPFNLHSPYSVPLSDHSATIWPGYDSPFNAIVGADSSPTFNDYQISDMHARWQEIDMTIDSNKYDFGVPEYSEPSRAHSIGSGHVSIGSAASSNHSWSSWRGRSRNKVLNRASSIVGRAKSAMKEGMSSWSLHGAKKHVSPSPRRTGKLTDAARAGIRLLRGQGACWKCKILKKSCDTGDPCKECASSTKLAWQTVGCQRGALSESFKPIKLCPNEGSSQAGREQNAVEDEDWAAKQAEANRLWEDEMRTRCTEVGATRLRIHRKTYSPHFPPEQLPILLLTDSALKQQVVKAMRELSPSLEEPKQKQEIFMVLYHASLYEEYLDKQTSPTNNLILLSIRCLNHSLDALRSEFSSATVHHACRSGRCGLHSVAKLQQSSSIYINALHDVMFSKWGLSNNRLWWLSVFYSLCIQGFVRVNLMKLSEHVQTSTEVSDQWSAAKVYLHSFISLFQAASAEYDPITMADDLSPAEMDQITLARIAANPWRWEEQGIHSSYDHLRRVFNVDGISCKAVENTANLNANDKANGTP